MKYLRSYENIENNLKYKNGDYVYINGEVTIYNSPIDNLGMITFYNSKLKNRTWDYMVEVWSKDKNKFINLYIDEKEIIRRLTPEEIEIYDIKKQSVKYNL